MAHNFWDLHYRHQDSEKISDHVAKFHGDGQRELRDHVAKKVKIFLKSAVKQVLPEQYTKNKN